MTKTACNHMPDEAETVCNKSRNDSANGLFGMPRVVCPTLYNQIIQMFFPQCNQILALRSAVSLDFIAFTAARWFLAKKLHLNFHSTTNFNIVAKYSVFLLFGCLSHLSKGVLKRFYK
jgi:hypothetical protein